MATELRSNCHNARTRDFKDLQEPDKNKQLKTLCLKCGKKIKKGDETHSVEVKSTVRATLQNK